MTQKFEFPAWLPPLDDARLAEIRDEQRARAERFNLAFVRPSPEDYRLHYARLKERGTLANMAAREAHLQRTISTPLSARAPGHVLALRDLKLSIAAERRQLAAAYAEQGRFDLAAEVEPDEETRADYAATHVAVMRPDSDRCTCPQEKTVRREAGEMRVRTENDIGVVFSVAHKRFMPLIECTECRMRNVRQLPEHLRERQSREHAHAREFAGKDPREALAALRDRGQTDAEVFGR